MGIGRISPYALNHYTLVPTVKGRPQRPVYLSFLMDIHFLVLFPNGSGAYERFS